MASPLQSDRAESLSRFATVREILRQPAVWRSFAPEAARLAADLKPWLARARHDEVWFCGAGTSAFIGETLATHLNRAPGPARFRAVPTTDLVASPKNWLRDGLRLLVVSFGRSGNSPETIGMLDLLAGLMPQADRLHITCNGESKLAKAPDIGPGELRTIVLPPETDDQGFAMTSSYTTMLLTALAIFDPVPPAPAGQMFATLAGAASQILDGGFMRLASIPRPERAVFLGAGALAGAAREAALKVLELTAGRVATSWDTPLGFRHGPKAVVNDATTVFLLQSCDPHTARYDSDLADEIAAQFGVRALVRLGPAPGGGHLQIPSVGSDAWNAVLHVLIAQILAVLWSDGLGLPVDDPFAGRNLSRVVSGVRLYPVDPEPVRLTGGIDVGGSKIEAVLYDGAMEPIAQRRVETAKGSYDALLRAIVAEALWLTERAGGPIDLGIGLPGLVDPADGRAVTSNLPATGQALVSQLRRRLGDVAIGNDCKCFALSEACGGAGAGFRTLFGLILGTGVGGGVVVDGRLATGLNGLPGEVGHIGSPAELADRNGLPLLACGCGRIGCYETLLSGPGLSRLAARLAGRVAEPAEIFRLADAGDADMARVAEVWVDLLAELLHTIQLTIDADGVILGGGLSRTPGLTGRLAAAFDRRRLSGVRSPQIVLARFGDASGARGAALLARTARG